MVSSNQTSNITDATKTKLCARVVLDIRRSVSLFVSTEWNQEKTCAMKKKKKKPLKYEPSRSQETSNQAQYHSDENSDLEELDESNDEILYDFAELEEQVNIQ